MLQELRALRRFAFLALLCAGLTAGACLNDEEISEGEGGLALAYNAQESTPNGRGWVRTTVGASVGGLGAILLIGTCIYQYRRD